jgi:phosphatidate phosphatase APP1
MLTVVDAKPYAAASAEVAKVSVIADADRVASVNVRGDVDGFVPDATL